MIEHDYKVPGGKLLRIKMTVEDDKISSILIMGDFFLHPEDTIVAIEKSLIGVNLGREGLLRSINSAMADKSAVLIGAAPEDIVNAILTASRKGP